MIFLKKIFKFNFNLYFFCITHFLQQQKLVSNGSTNQSAMHNGPINHNLHDLIIFFFRKLKNLLENPISV